MPSDVATPPHAPPAPDAQMLPILLMPDKRLRVPTRRVGPGDAAAIRALVPRMFATMYNAPGIGLAAPQVGTGLRLAIVDLMQGNTPGPLVLVNPEVVQRSEETTTREEGCLSLPGQYADVTRPARVRVRYEDIEGARREIDADNLLSACLQHEIDHLDGRLFVDHISILKRNMLLRRLAKELRQRAAEQGT